MLFQDVRYALRSLWYSKGFAITAILCLGFGIGLNSTIFSIVDGVLLKPFPYNDPDRIVVPAMHNRPLDISEGSFSYLDYRDLKAAASSYATVAVVTYRSLTISDGGEPERFQGGLVSWDLFSMLGVAPILGQPFGPAHDQPGGGGVALISHALWKTRYQSAPSVIGRQILVNAKPVVILGVMPEGFEFPENQKLWIPIAPVVSNDARNNRSLNLFARLKPGVSVAQAATETDAIMTRIAAEHPDTSENWGAHVNSLREEFIPADVSLVIWLMMGAATIVLFIACSNVANLQLARASTRRREISVRAALGAGRRRIVTQLLTESVVLSLLCLPLGLIIAQVGTKMIASAMPPDDVPYYIHWEVDARSVLFTIAVAVGTAVLFGLFPALQSSRGDLHGDLKEGTRGNSARRSLLRSGLVITQVALALISLVGAMLFVRSFTNLDSYEVGFYPKPLMSMRFYMPGEPYLAADAKTQRVQDIVQRVEQLPGAVAAFASNLVPLQSGGGGGNIVVDGVPSEKGHEPGISFTGVTPHFLKALGVPLTRGRDFTDAEGWSRTPLAIINETMATQLWAGRDALGGRFRMTAGSDETNDWFTVIGVVKDIKQDGIDPDDKPFPAAYVPYPYQQTINTGLTIRVASGDPAAITAAVRHEIRASDSNLPIFQVATLEELRRLGFWQFALFGWIFGTIGVVGLLLASVGVYGVLSYAVTQRTQEIGVRVALGATRGIVLKLIVAQGMLLAGIGVAIGLAGSAAAMPLAQSLLYNVSPFDPITFAAVSVFLLAVALVASVLPGLRATKVDPLVALRRV